MKRTRERTLDARKFKKLLKDNGWEIDRTCKSSHVIYKKGDKKVMIKCNSVNAMIQGRLIKELDLK